MKQLSNQVCRENELLCIFSFFLPSLYTITIALLRIPTVLMIASWLDNYWLCHKSVINVKYLEVVLQYIIVKMYALLKMHIKEDKDRIIFLLWFTDSKSFDFSPSHCHSTTAYLLCDCWWYGHSRMYNYICTPCD